MHISSARVELLYTPSPPSFHQLRGCALYVGNPGFGMHCHPLDTMNAGFLLASATGKRLGFLWMHVQGFIK